MSMKLYPRLAWDGIRKNRRLYVPYILSCIGMVMMSYIMQSISYSPLLRNMRGGGNVQLILSLGKFVIASFALIFLFYTNSFLIRRRFKEFGLYNILGMGKRGIKHIITWESLFIAIFGMVGGIGLGILFSKFAELGLLNAIHTDIDYRFTIAPEAVKVTVIIFGIIFILLFLRSFIQVSVSRPLELLRSENAGERVPKVNWVFALAGAILLGIAYYMAASIKSPLTALVIFFIAVIMVIVATYLLFISGSVALCRILQRNKNYYYKKNHFVSVSSMVYRMRRNGAGLASICILATMVLVMCSSSASLYIGAEDAIRGRLQRENELSVFLNYSSLTAENISALTEAYDSAFAEEQVTPKNVLAYPYANISGEIKDDYLNTNADIVAGTGLASYDSLRDVYFVTLATYNHAMGTNYTLEPGHVLLYPANCQYDKDSINIEGTVFQIAGNPGSFITISEAASNVVPAFMVVVPDMDALAPLTALTYDGENPSLRFKWYYGYDLDEPDERVIEVLTHLRSVLKDIDFINGENGYMYSFECLPSNRYDFFSTFGGLFFLGITLSLVFICAAAMIIYYKQVSEGYEDQARFEIMQKVGMTKEDIKKSINSQILTVFFAPLLTAGLHLAFAFPLIWKLLQLFYLRNLSLIIYTTIGSFLLFGLIYIVIYKVTARAYYSIVASSSKS